MDGWLDGWREEGWMDGWMEINNKEERNLKMFYSLQT